MQSPSERFQARKGQLAFMIAERNVIEVLHVPGKGTNRVTRDYRVFWVNGERDLIELTGTVAVVAGLPYSDKRECIVLKGHGFNGPDAIAEHLALALGMSCGETIKAVKF